MLFPLISISRVCNDHHVSADNIAECDVQHGSPTLSLRLSAAAWVMFLDVAQHQ